MKVSEITLSNIYEYCRVNSSELTVAETALFQAYLNTAKAFVKSYTGLESYEIDEHEDFSIVIFILVEDMHDNRRLYVDKNNLNKVVETILGMHCTNLL